MSGPLLTVEVATTVAALAPEVRSFMLAAERGDVEAGPDWYENLIATVFPGDPGIRFYALRDGARVLALLPLRATGGRLHALANFYTTLYQPLLADGVTPAQLVPLLAAVVAEFPRAATLTLAPMDPQSDSYRQLLVALRLLRWAPYEYFAFGNWSLPVSGDWATYLGTRQGTLRSTIKRMGKKFGGAGGTLEIITDPAQMARGVAAYETVYAASWKQPEPFPAFMPGLLRNCAARGMLRLGLAWLDGQPVAAQMWIVSHGRAAIYKVAYHESYKQYAPGTLLTALLMAQVMDVDHVTEVDYLIGDDPYKKVWMSQRRERWGIVAYNPRTLRGLAGLAREALGRALKPVRGWLRQRLRKA